MENGQFIPILPQNGHPGTRIKVSNVGGMLRARPARPGIMIAVTDKHLTSSTRRPGRAREYPLSTVG